MVCSLFHCQKEVNTCCKLLSVTSLSSSLSCMPVTLSSCQDAPDAATSPPPDYRMLGKHATFTSKPPICMCSFLPPAASASRNMPSLSFLGRGRIGQLLCFKTKQWLIVLVSNYPQIHLSSSLFGRYFICPVVQRTLRSHWCS